VSAVRFHSTPRRELSGYNESCGRFFNYYDNATTSFLRLAVSHYLREQTLTMELLCLEDDAFYTLVDKSLLTSNNLQVLKRTTGCQVSKPWKTSH
jgi:hypothetical protein